jgi:hypothetical protein
MTLHQFRHNSTHIAFHHFLMINKLKELEMIIDKKIIREIMRKNNDV